MPKKGSQSLWYPRYVGDYQRKTSHLSLVEHGIYTLLLDHYYSSGKPLDANASRLQNVCRAFAETEIAAMHSVLREYFTATAEGYRNQRADEEIAKRCNISKKRTDAANSRHALAPAKAPASAYANAGANAGANGHARAPAIGDTTTTTYKLIGGGTRERSQTVHAAVLDLIPRGHEIPSLSAGGWGIVETWLSSGADPDLDIYPIVRQLLKTEPSPNSLKYFTNAISRAMNTRLQTVKDFANGTASGHQPANGASPNRAASMSNTAAYARVAERHAAGRDRREEDISGDAPASA